MNRGSEWRKWNLHITKPRVETVFILFVSLSFNKPHVSAPPRTKIRDR